MVRPLVAGRSATHSPVRSRIRKMPNQTSPWTNVSGARPPSTERLLRNRRGEADTPHAELRTPGVQGVHPDPRDMCRRHPHMMSL